MKIVKYNSKYYQKIKDLLKNDDKDPKTNLAYTLEFFDKKFGNYYKSWIALDEKKVIGVITMSIQLYTAEINFVFVDDKYRGKGIAKSLAKELIKYAKKVNCDGLRANCNCKNIASKNFNLSIGMRIVGKIKNYYSNNETQNFYWKKL